MREDGTMQTISLVKVSSETLTVDGTPMSTFTKLELPEMHQSYSRCSWDEVLYDYGTPPEFIALEHIRDVAERMEVKYFPGQYLKARRAEALKGRKNENGTSDNW